MNTSKTTKENRKLDDDREAAERRRRIRRILIASSVTLFFLALVTYFSYRIYIEYQRYIDPSNVYGDWIEIGAPPYQTEVLTLSDQGVYRNNRLIATSYQFNGKRIIIETGIGLTVYQITGNDNSPQLRRLVPDSPSQRLVKKGFEHTVLPSSGGAAQASPSITRAFQPLQLMAPAMEESLTDDQIMSACKIILAPNVGL